MFATGCHFLNREATPPLIVFVALFVEGAPATIVREHFQKDFTEDVRGCVSDHHVNITTLRENDLALQHHGRNIGLHSVVHMNTEYLGASSINFILKKCGAMPTSIFQISLRSSAVYLMKVSVASHSSNISMVHSPAGTGETYTEKEMYLCSPSISRELRPVHRQHCVITALQHNIPVKPRNGALVLATRSRS